MPSFRPYDLVLIKLSFSDQNQMFVYGTTDIDDSLYCLPNQLLFLEIKNLSNFFCLGFLCLFRKYVLKCFRVLFTSIWPKSRQP